MLQSLEAHFLAFWSAYPRRIAKLDARRAYTRAVRDGAAPEAIVAGVERYKTWLAESDQETRFIKYPASWLNAGCWEDDYQVDLPEKPQTDHLKNIALPRAIITKLLAVRITPDEIRRWFAGAEFSQDGVRITLPTEFMRAYVSNHFMDRLRLAFGVTPDLFVMKKTA